MSKVDTPGARDPGLASVNFRQHIPLILASTLAHINTKNVRDSKGAFMYDGS